MKYGMVIAVAATGLFVSAAALRGRPQPEAPLKRPAARVATSAKPSPAPPVANPARASDLALRMYLLETEKRAAEAAHAGGELSRYLGINPVEWPEVIDLVMCLEDSSVALKIVETTRHGLSPEGVSRWLDMLRAPRRPDDRRLALAALRGRSSPGILAALREIAENDPDPRARRQAVEQLAARRNASNAADDRLIQEALTRKAHADADEGVRREAAQSLVQPDPVALMYASQPQPRKSPFSRRNRNR